jgi:hydrogenase expression/formation protein HypD
MHVCGTHEQAIARYGLRAVLPKALHLIMGPGCPVCVTDMHEVDEAVSLARRGVHLATYGDMLRLPGHSASLADAKAEGAPVHVVYSPMQAVELSRKISEEVVFFASGFETTAVTTAAVLASGPPANFSVLSAHKYVPLAMEAVAQMPNSRVEGFLAAGHAAIITGSDLFLPFATKYHTPVVVTGFEPLDILAALLCLVTLIHDKKNDVINAYPRCVNREGNRRAQESLWRFFQVVDGPWRGIGIIPGGTLELRDSWACWNARRRFTIDTHAEVQSELSPLAEGCLCGQIMVGLAMPCDCPLFGRVCHPEAPIGACMVSTEGMCRIWHQYGGQQDLGLPG